MKKQIFTSICIVAITVLLASIIIIMGALYSYFSSLQTEQLVTETNLMASAFELSGESYLYVLPEGDYRVTWIDSDGIVLFDNKVESSEMENHLEREEIKEALETGIGESSRYSTTLMERQLYCAKKLSDGSVLRLSTTHLSWWALAFGMLYPIIIVIIISVILSVFLAYRLSNRIVKPLNNIDLEKPDLSTTYEEISPILSRLISQRNLLKEKEYELNKKKKEFDTATENMREGLILLNESGTILSINPAASKILKVSQFSIGKDLIIINNSFDLNEILSEANNGNPTEKIISINGKDYQFNASPIITDEKLNGIALIIIDITEKEKAESARREFTANVSHELKTPLQNISGSAELLSNGIVKPEDVPEFSKRIYAESKRMIVLIDDIIKLSHLDENSQNFEYKETDLYELATPIWQNLMEEAKKQNISFTLNGESSKINGIPQLLSEIIYNLCENAIKYNYENGSVNMSIKDFNDKSVLTVSDSGIGIPEEEKERIFERFYRVDKSRSKEVGGTGLGLSIVKHAVQLHNGTINVESNIGFGTTISITFPKN